MTGVQTCALPIYKPQTRWEHLAHQILILGVNNHSLLEVAYFLYRVRSTIVHGECWLSKPPRKFSSLNSTCERQPENLVQHLTHSIISQAFARWAPTSTFTVVILITREGFTKRSSRPGSVSTILLIARREIRIRGSSSLSFVVQLLFQMINHSLHGSSTLLMRKVAPASRLAPTSISGMHTNLPVPFSLKINKMILMLRPH